jgi:hypothetical protein
MTREEFEQRLCADLEQRGLTPAQALALAARLEPSIATLGPTAYQAVLDAACAGHAAQKTAQEETPPAEIQRLIQDFAVELQKLDEGLQLLSTYLLRIRDRSRGDRPVRLVH